MMTQEMQIAIAALSIAYLLGGVVKRVLDRMMPPPHVERQLEILKSIDSRLEKMNGAVAKTLETVEENSDGIEKLKNTFLPHGQLDAEGFPRWWCQWPRAKDGIMNILDDVREMLKKKEV